MNWCLVFYCSGRGAVITVSAAASIIPTPLVTVYAATKVCININNNN